MSTVKLVLTLYQQQPLAKTHRLTSFLHCCNKISKIERVEKHCSTSTLNARRLKQHIVITKEPRAFEIESLNNLKNHEDHLQQSQLLHLGSISPTFYEQLLCLQIPKAQKNCSTLQSFLCFWDLQA